MMKKFLLLYTYIILGLANCLAQNFNYDNKHKISNDLFIVKSGSSYGIINTKNDVVVSIEYDNILFRNKYALLTKGGTLKGVVDTLGKVTLIPGDYCVHPYYKYVYEDYIIVGNVNKWFKNKWGFIDVTGRPLRFKIKGGRIIGKKFPTLFDEVTPFVDGFATVYVNKKGWRHIDKGGRERFILDNKKASPIFRSSPYRGECIIATSDGVKYYQENGLHKALVKKVFTTSATLKEVDMHKLKVYFNDVVLNIDSLKRVHKLFSKSDSTVLIAQPKKIVKRKVMVAPKKDTISISKDILFSLNSNIIKANSRGRASLGITIKNISESDYRELFVSIKCGISSKVWKGELKSGSDLKLYINIPARFSSNYIKRNVDVKISCRNQEISERRSVTIRRFNPQRSRH